MGWMWRLRIERDERLVLGSRREGPWVLRSTRLKWLNNPGGKPQTPCDPGLCKIFPEAKTAAKAWAQGLRQPPDYTTGTSARACVHATLRFFHYPRKRHNRFHPRRSRA